MNKVFPEPIRNLPEADIPLVGITAYLSQSDIHQILFMQFEKDADLPEHSHAAQIGIVLKGKIELVIDGEKQCFTKGDRYPIPEGVRHSGKIYAGYADITFFNEPNRYSINSIWHNKAVSPVNRNVNQDTLQRICKIRRPLKPEIYIPYINFKN